MIHVCHLLVQRGVPFGEGGGRKSIDNSVIMRSLPGGFHECENSGVEYSWSLIESLRAVIDALDDMANHWFYLITCRL